MRRGARGNWVTAMDEYNPTPARISDVAGRVTFCLRTDTGEVIELDPVL